MVLETEMIATTIMATLVRREKITGHDIQIAGISNNIEDLELKRDTRTGNVEEEIKVFKTEMIK